MEQKYSKLEISFIINNFNNLILLIYKQFNIFIINTLIVIKGEK